MTNFSINEKLPLDTRKFDTAQDFLNLTMESV